MPTAAETLVASEDNEHNSSLSALRLSEIALEPVVTGDSVADTVNEESATSDRAVESELSQLSRESVSASAETQHHTVENAETPERVTAEAAETEAGRGNSQTGSTTSLGRSRPVGIIYQSSLPDLTADREDKDSASAVVRFLSSFFAFIFCCCCYA